MNAGLHITITDERNGKSHDFKFEGGIGSFVEYLNAAKSKLHDKPITFKGEKDLVQVEIAMQWNEGYDEKIFTFANNINTPEGGTHLSGFKAALTKSINGYAERTGLWKDLKEQPTGDDAREGLACVISVKIPQPQFEGQTKQKLGNSEVKGLVEKPAPADAPSNLSIIGRYVLLPQVIEHLERHERGAGGEIQLTDGMARMIGNTPFHGLRYEGQRFDCGDKLGFLEAQIAYALKRDDLAAGVRGFLKNYCGTL